MKRPDPRRFFRDNAHWLQSLQEARNVLAGGTLVPKALKPNRCPLCGHNTTPAQTQRQHLRDVHELSKKEINNVLA